MKLWASLNTPSSCLFWLFFLLTHYPHLQTFAKKDLPEKHRVVKEGDMMTMDHNPDRLNIHVDDDGTVTKVTHGWKFGYRGLSWNNFEALILLCMLTGCHTLLNFLTRASLCYRLARNQSTLIVWPTAFSGSSLHTKVPSQRVWVSMGSLKAESVVTWNPALSLPWWHSPHMNCNRLFHASLSCLGSFDILPRT